MANESLNFTINLNGNAYKGILQIDDSLKGVLNSVDSARSAFKKLGDASVRFDSIVNTIGKVSDGFKFLAGDSLKFEQTQLNLQTLLGGSAEAADELVGKLREYGKNTVYDFNGLAEAQKTMMSFGIEGNPAHTGEVFTDNANYIRTLNRSDVNIGQKIVKFYRDNLRSKYETTSINIDTDFGYILIDNITIQEITKGAKTEKSFFYKQEIVQNIEHYIKQMVLIDGHETIDLSHNNHRSIFYQRKKLFTHMEVYRLDIGGYSYCIKFGVFRNEGKNLYCITEPDW